MTSAKTNLAPLTLRQALPRAQPRLMIFRLVFLSLVGTPRWRENRGGLPADAGLCLGREPAH